MATLEQVEKLREKTDVSFEEAKAALEASGDDLLEAIIYLERQGRVQSPVGGGYYSSQNTQQQDYTYSEAGGPPPKNGGSFKEAMGKLGRFLAKVFHIGNTNYLVAEKNGAMLFECPVTALVLLLLFFFWVVVPLFVVSLFFGFHYRFRGNEMGTDGVNKVMDGASDTVEDIKKNFTNDNGGAQQ